MYKDYGEQRDPGPAKNNRSRREDAGGTSFQATAERSSSSYSHLISGNNDTPSVSFGYSSLEFFLHCVAHTKLKLKSTVSIDSKSCAGAYSINFYGLLV